jgi:hypothetical protein
MDKTRKFDFESSVRIPEMDEIMKVASDFSDPEATKTTPNLKEALSQNAKVAPKLGSEMSSMRQKMRKLAREIADEESNVAEPVADNLESVEADEVKSDIADPDVVSKEEAISKQEKVLPKKTQKEKEPASEKKPGSTNKKK